MSGVSVPIAIRDLTKTFDKTTQVLRGVDLTIEAGSVVGLLGVNGSGKTTLMKILVGLFKADGGSVQVFGEDPWSLSVEAKHRTGYVPQEVSVAAWMTVEHVVRYTSAFYGELWDHAWAETLLDRFELDRRKRAGTLSGGQTQKLGLVLAMGHRPELLLFDEPVAALDPISRRDLLVTLVELVDETGADGRRQTVLFSTHITADLERIASHVALLKAGRVSLYSEMDTLKESVQRVRVTSSEPLPPELPAAKTLHVSRDARTVTATLTDGRVDLWREWAAAHGADSSVDLLNLEDLFIELHGKDAAADDSELADRSAAPEWEAV